MSPLIYIDREAGLEAPDDDSFSCWITSALTGSGIAIAAEPEISLRINDLDEMAELNATYRGKQGPTNVLSFPADLPDAVESELLGDIVICAPVVECEASEQNKSLESHWAHMTVHGVLHLLGFDHIEEQEAIEMESLETAILATLGFPDPYQVGPDEEPGNQPTNQHPNTTEES